MSCWIRGVQGLCKVCSLHGLVSDGVLLPGVEPHTCGCVGLVMDPSGVGSTDPPLCLHRWVGDTTAFLLSPSYLIAE